MIHIKIRNSTIINLGLNMLPLVKHRVLKMITSAKMAEELSVSQKTYESWESAESPIPKNKWKKICSVLGITEEELHNWSLPIDELGGKGYPDNRTYYGEITVHFASGNFLIAPITKQQFYDFNKDTVRDSGRIVIESLDNRIVVINPNFVEDIFFSAEAFDNYGPEKYKYTPIPFFDAEEWLIFERATSGSDFIPECEKTNGVMKYLELIDGKEEQGIIEENSQNVKWLTRSGKVRSECFYENSQVFSAADNLIEDEFDPFIKICDDVDGYYREAIINFNLIEYISFPFHKYEYGMIENLYLTLQDEEWID